MLYGASGAGKSHIALDIAVCIANGIPWCKKNTEKGFVFIMAGEGHGGLNRRLKVIEKTRKIRIDKQKILLSERAIGIDTEDGFKEVVAAIDAQPSKPDFIIIDTLSRHIMKSSENSNVDMANFINKLEQLQRRYDATIMIVHHTLSQAKT
jgi:RecA-family ATPase